MKIRLYDPHYNIDQKIIGQMALNFKPPSTKSTSLRIKIDNGDGTSVMILFNKKETEEILNFLAANSE